ncbi:MAG: hypothetical protein O9327_01965 [Polaromonas sp.]|nr:hypothetical protein [Polaromonas sp.]
MNTSQTNTARSDLQVFSADGSSSGIAKHPWYRCRLEGCTGRRLTVVWPDGKTTRPCSKGMHQRADGHWQIG